MFLGILGSLIAWLIIPPISQDIGRVRRWLASGSAVGNEGSGTSGRICTKTESLGLGSPYHLLCFG